MGRLASSNLADAPLVPVISVGRDGGRGFLELWPATTQGDAMSGSFSMLAILAASWLPGQEPASHLARIRPAPAAELTGTDGASFRLESLRGKVALVSFVFTTCNGTCPATTHNLYRVQQALEAAGIWGDDVEFVSITLDPANDRPETLARYADVYGIDRDHWHFLTGSEEQIADTLTEWDMWARRTPDGQLDHPSRIFLIDPSGTIREIYNLAFLRVPGVVEDIQGLLRECR